MRNLCAFFAETGSISIDKWQNCLAVSELRKSADSRSYYFLPRMDAGGGFSFSAEFDMLQLLEKELIYVDNRNYVSYLPSSLLKKERSGVASDVDKIKILSADSLSSEVADLLFGETPTLSLESGKDVSVYSIISDVMPSERYVASVYNSNIKNVFDMSELDPRLSRRSPVSASGLMSLYGIGLEYENKPEALDEVLDNVCRFASEHKKIVLALDEQTAANKYQQIRKRFHEENIDLLELPLAGKK